jgi:hypothetical protein
MKMISRIVAVIVMILGAGPAFAQTTQPTQPTTRPSDRALSPDEMLSQMLRSTAGGGAKPLQPTVDAPQINTTTGANAVAPGAAQLQELREGTFIVDRTGRLTRSADGQQWEFTFESDGRAMQDPPVVVLPNLKLMSMENAIKGSNRDLKFRITGMVTEYGGRNYILLEKVVVVPEVTQGNR